MKTIARLAKFRLSDDRLPMRVVQGMCYAMAPAVLFLAAHGLARFSSRPAEILIGLLAAGGLAVSLVVLGTVIAMATDARRS